MIRQYNSLKRTNFTLSDFCTGYEINLLRNYLSNDGVPHSWVPLTVWGEPGPFEDAHRRDGDFSFTVFEGQVLNDDVRREDGRSFNTDELNPDRNYTNFVADNERY